MKIKTLKRRLVLILRNLAQSSQALCYADIVVDLILYVCVALLGLWLIRQTVCLIWGDLG